MSITCAGLRIARRAVRTVELPVTDLPAFLCPGVLKITRPFPGRNSHKQPKPFVQAPQRRLLGTIPDTTIQGDRNSSAFPLERLPQQCPGCGALSQFVDEQDPGFYTLSRRAVKDYLGANSTPQVSAEDAIVKAAIENAGSAAENLNLGELAAPSKVTEPPICDRCHKLKHHTTGVSIHHPSIESIEDTIFESPYKYNHVYHILDAADFPMSLVPGLQKLLHVTAQRSMNRRAKTGRFYNGKKTEVSFIITRSDLLAPLKQQVDSMMPYLRATLRDALGRTAKDVRLGNIRCVSAKLGWWTKELKEDIWRRGGGGWMVGKVNVGKSQLFHDVFPKGRRDTQKLIGQLMPQSSTEILKETQSIASGQEAAFVDQETADEPLERELVTREPVTESTEKQSSFSPISPQAVEFNYESSHTDSLNTSTLLPPAPPETDYPVMPLVSHLPGTTASPIRLSFGSGKGELIDLPGLSRGDLELHIKLEHRASLVMRSRVTPEQQTIKPGQSLLLGGFIRITPTDSDTIILSYAFTPIKCHRTSTEKAIGAQTETRESNIENIALPGTGQKTKSAGIFHLKWDVTRQRTGPITASDAANIKPENLPYRVLSTDILIEGCGWVELVAQVRRTPNQLASGIESQSSSEFLTEKDGEEGWDLLPREEENEQIDPSWPVVEVFTPGGKFVASRRPMNAWLNVASKPVKGALQAGQGKL